MHSQKLKGQTIKQALRVLMVTGVYPTEQIPHAGTFIKSQADSLIAAGLEVEVIHPKPGPVAADARYSKQSAFVEHISHWLCRQVDAAIVKSEGMQKAVSVSEDNIFIIPNGVDFELFRPIPRAEARATLGWDLNRYYVLFCNNPQIPVKNFPLAQAVIERLRARGISAELVVANGLPQTTVVQYINASNALI